MQLTYEKARYGMLVEVLHDDGSYHAGCKVHFFNQKGALVGNYYKFFPYDKLRIRGNVNGIDRQYPRYFYGKKLEGLKMFFFKLILWITSGLIRFTQNKMA